MEKTTYQRPEIRGANNNIIQSGAYGKNTAFCNSQNTGILDYINNNLEWLKANTLEISAVADRVDRALFNTDGFDRNNLDALLNSCYNETFRTWGDWNSAAYSPENNNSFWRYIALAGGGISSNYAALLAIRTNDNLVYVAGGYKKEWTMLDGVEAEGSNYIRYKSGLQICWGTESVTASKQITFPVPFYNCSVLVSANANGYCWSTGAGNSSFVFNCSNYGTGITARYIAIGRWKAL